jgi:serine/threonine-protein kinase
MQLPTTISPDGSRVVFNVFSRRMDTLRPVRAEGRSQSKVLIDAPLEERNGAISPNARWLAYEGESSTKPGQVDVYVRPFPDVESGLWQVTTAGGAHPAWGPGGRELFYVAPDGALVAVPVEATVTTWRNGSPAVLFRGPYLYRADGSLGRDYDVAPDGTRFLMLKDTTAPGPSHFVVVQNWTEALRRLFARE